METACLRIKFNPLIQKKTINNSKCCLEILPEVLCIQNLDKLIWRQETNIIEFTIPMTHKVVLQKRQVKRDNSDTTVKTYHSCVDLLLTSSNSMLGSPGSGDVSKVISDTLIPTKCLKNCTSKEHFILALTDERRQSDNYIILPTSHVTINTLVQLEDIEKKETETNTMDDEVQATTNESKNNLTVDVFDEKLDKITNTESMYPVLSNTVQSGNVEMKTGTIKSAIKHESKRWLSLSPICSVNTRKSPLVSKIVSSKAVNCEIYESQKDFVVLPLLRNISSPSDLSHDYHTPSTIIDVSRQNSPNKISVPCRRTAQEMKVVEYVRLIEKEILPLKMWLNDIIRKCTELGIEFSKQPSEQSVTFKSISTSSGPEMKIYEDHSKSNRVVYSIVYDG